MSKAPSETILIVDDRDSNRALVAEILGMNDYKVLEARNGLEAKELGERHPEPLNLLITDLVMPEMNGMELAAHLRPLRPEMKVLYISGFMADASVQMEVWDASADFLAKPFSPDALLGKVSELLGHGSDESD